MYFSVIRMNDIQWNTYVNSVGTVTLHTYITHTLLGLFNIFVSKFRYRERIIRRCIYFHLMINYLDVLDWNKISWFIIISIPYIFCNYYFMILASLIPWRERIAQLCGRCRPHSRACTTRYPCMRCAVGWWGCATRRVVYTGAMFVMRTSVTQWSALLLISVCNLQNTLFCLLL